MPVEVVAPMHARTFQVLALQCPFDLPDQRCSGFRIGAFKLLQINTAAEAQSGALTGLRRFRQPVGLKCKRFRLETVHVTVFPRLS